MPTRHGAQIGRALAVAVLLVLALAVPMVLAADKSVAIRDFVFSPKAIEVRVGDVVTWTNRDTVAHTATARGGTFDTGLIQPGQSASIRFTIGGTYRYICTPHPNMTGTVVVRAASGDVRPPNTSTAAVIDDDATGPWHLAVVLAIVGLVGYVIGRRRFRRRETD